MSLLLGDQLNKYRTLFNPFYFGITSTVQNIIRDYNISNPIIGGEITKSSIDNNIIKADIVYNKEKMTSYNKYINNIISVSNIFN